jgi:tRNA-dihydrouridine synthase C
MPVSAKMRLGFNADALAVDCGLAIAAGGADELVVHARTRAQAYRPPAYWERIADIRAAVRIPVVANGEIWTLDDARRCREASGSDMLMLGRGIVTDPGLGLAIKASFRDGTAGRVFSGADRAAGAASTGHAVDAASVAGTAGITWLELLPLLAEFWRIVCGRLEVRARAGRFKQWLNFLRRRFPEAELAYQQLRTVNDPVVIDAWLAGVVQ